MTKVFGAPAPNASLFAGGTSAYRRRWDHVLGRLGISVSMPSRGATPAVCAEVVQQRCTLKVRTLA